jgi:hypothetical protein
MKVYIGKYRSDITTYKWKTPDWFNDIAQSIINMSINSWRKHFDRNAFVKIDNHDIWDAQITLGHVILPTLKMLKNANNGAPFVEDEDVPMELKSSNFKLENEWDTDEAWFYRWNYVINEMIFAFENIVDESWGDQFHIGKVDVKFEPCNDGTDCSERVKGPNDTYKFDKEGYKKYNERINKGLLMFGKYYRNLWD